MRYWLMLWCIRRFRTKCGPMMFTVRNRWIFVDYRGQIWQLIERPEINGCPLQIMLLQEP